MRNVLVLIVSSAAAVHTPSAVAATLTASQAQAIIAGCVAHATENKNVQAIAVVDTGGRLIASLRMDNAGFGKMEFAEAKAVAAAAWGFDTAGQADGAKDFPGFARAPYVQTVPGGIPVWSADGQARVGAVGVSGAEPSADVACAVAGVRSAGLRASRS